MVRADAGAEQDVRSEAGQIIADLREATAAGDQHWFLALMAAVRNWPLPSETVGEREYRYLVGGEAFDWILLAERLLDEVRGLVPEEEADALLFEERLPIELSEAEFQQLLGAKYKAHLNFVYGVRIEGALKIAVSEEVRKEHSGSRIWENGHADDEAFARIYGRPREEMLSEFRAAAGIEDPEWLSLGELAEWRYWLFQYRIKSCDPARVASDTRKGLAFLQRLEASRRRTDIL
jgi:hypothetical protein